MPKRTKSYEAGLHDRLRDPSYAMEYLQAALEDDEEGADAVVLQALRDVAQANHMSYVAEATGLNRESLYKMLSRRGNPGINSLRAVLNAVGLRLAVEVATPKALVAKTCYQDIVSWEPKAGDYGFSYDVAPPNLQETASRVFLGKPPPRRAASK